jgi:hypothetical protein
MYRLTNKTSNGYPPCARGSQVKGGFESFVPGKIFAKKGGRKMSHLKNENLNKCFSLLREYLDDGPSNNKKGAAILALDHLQKITGGTDSQDATFDGSPVLFLGCQGKPKVDG